MKRKAPIKLTQANIAKLSLPEGKRDEIWFDKEMHGFGLRIRSDGKNEHRTFVAQYKIGTKHRRITLGNAAKVKLEVAKAEAKRIFGKVAHGKDPAGEKTAARAEASNAIEALIAAYLEAKKGKQRPRTYQQTEYRLNRLWKPLHKFTAGTVSRAAVAAQVATIAKESGPIAANRARGALSAMFRWAIGEGLCNDNPVAGTNKQQENEPRERVLSDAEAAVVWLGCPGNDYGRIVQLLLLTGCRRDEIGSLQWSETDMDAKTITLPAIRTKNSQTHVVPLSDTAMGILQAIPRRDRTHVFGVGEGGYSGWSKAKMNLDKATKLKEPWTLHDLRRTVRTGLGMLGVAPHVAEAVLNHLPAKLIRTYDRNTYATEKRAALDTWGNHIRVIVAQSDGANVHKLKRNKPIPA